MKESNTIVGNAANNFLRGGILLNIKGQYMKESNTHVGSAIKNFFQRQVLPDTRDLYMKVNKD